MRCASLALLLWFPALVCGAELSDSRTSPVEEHVGSPNAVLALADSAPSSQEAQAAAAEAKEAAQPVTESAVEESATPASKTVAVKLGEMTFQVPESWAQEKPKSKLRLGQFSIPAVEGDSEPAELAIFDRIAGTDKQNIERWVGQFGPEGLTSKMTKGKAELGDYIFVELTGSYKKPIGAPFMMKSELVEGYTMLGVVFAAKSGGNYFFKLTGPQKTVAAAAEGYRRSFGGDSKAEVEYVIEE